MIKPPKYLPGSIVYLFNPDYKKEIGCVKVLGATYNLKDKKWMYFIDQDQDEGLDENLLFSDIETLNKHL